VSPRTSSISTCRHPHPYLEHAPNANQIVRSVRLSADSYRLCPRPRSPSEPLTEACFQRTPLAFVGNTTDLVGPAGEVFRTIAASRTTVGTTPAGSEWTRNPVPDQHDLGVPPNFPPPVAGLSGHCCDQGCADGCGSAFGGTWNILDRVRVPRGLAPGDYVLSWRWDAEELPQVQGPPSLPPRSCAAVRTAVCVSLPVLYGCGLG
jgi:hypothetical protein